MNTRPHPNNRQRGGILFWLLVVVVMIVVATIIVGLYKMCKRLDKPFKPRWDDVNWEELDAEAEAAALIGQPSEAEAIAYRRYILPPGFGLIFRTSEPTPIPAVVLSNAVTPLEGQSIKGAGFTDTDGSEWTTSSDGMSCYRTMSLEDMEAWQMPPPNPELPSVFYHKMMVRTNWDTP